MSEKIKLADLMKEKMQEEAAAEQAQTQTEEVRTEVNSEPAPVYMHEANFDPSKLGSVDLSEIVPSGAKDATKDAQDELIKELDDGIADAIERRFGPAMEEVREMQREYHELVAMGEKNPKVESKYDPSLELDPTLSDEDIKNIRREQEEYVMTDDEIEATSPSIVTDDDDIEKEFDEYDKSIVSESIKPNLNSEAELISPSVETIKPTVDEDEELDSEMLEEDEYDDFLDDLGLDDEKEQAERIREEKRQQRNLEEFSRVLRQQLEEDGNRKPDISKFKVRKRPVAVNKVLSKPTEKKYYEWGLFATGISISMSPLSAIELEEISPYSDAPNDIARARTLFSTLYRHLSPECRNLDMEVWLKLLNYQDLNHLFFALYNANFSTSNIIPFSCTKCNHFFTEKRPVIDMVKFGSDEDKERFNAIISKDPSIPGTVEEELYVANDEYAFGIVVPKIYNSMFEERLLDDTFRDKYAGIINISHCISTVYEIDQDNEELIPIQFNYAQNDIVKTYKYRIRSIYKILSKLSAYDFKELQNTIAKYIEENNKGIDISYQVPSTTCPKCGEAVEAIPMNAQELVFTRHRLIHMLD